MRSIHHRSRNSVAILGLAAAVCAAAVLSPSRAAAATFAVNSAADVHDANPGDGVCETATGNAICTLRAAIEEANALPGADTLTLQPATTYLMTAGHYPITDDLTITGATGAIIDGDNASGIFYVMCHDGLVCDAGLPAVVVTISDVTLQHGNDVVGAAIDSKGQVSITDSVLADNSDLKYAAVYNGGTMTLLRCWVHDNITTPNPGGGGGVRNLGTMLIRDSTISANQAVSGAGIDASDGSLVIVDSTISGNKATGYGGGLSIAAQTALYNVTIFGNQANSDVIGGAAFGAGIANFAPAASLSVDNSIIAGNTTPIDITDSVADDCSGPLTSLGDNLIGAIYNSQCTVSGATAYVRYGDAMLGPLQDNGGPTPTQALLPDSPAFDANTLGGCTDNLGAPITTDQRGEPRPNGRRCDLGAFELQETIFWNGFEP